MFYKNSLLLFVVLFLASCSLDETYPLKDGDSIQICFSIIEPDNAQLTLQTSLPYGCQASLLLNSGSEFTSAFVEILGVEHNGDSCKEVAGGRSAVFSNISKSVLTLSIRSGSKTDIYRLSRPQGNSWQIDSSFTSFTSVRFEGKVFRSKN